MAKQRELSQLDHYLAYPPLHLYYETAADGTKVLRHIRVQQRTFDVPADGITIDTVPPDSVGSEEIKDGGVEMQDLSQDVKDSMAERVKKEDLDNFEV